MSKLWARLAGAFRNRTFAGMDKAGNRYFARKEEIDGIIEWICWLNGQRRRAPTPEEMIELEARRERVRLNVALLKKEEEERRAKEGIKYKGTSTSKVGGPDLRSFIQQFPADSEGDRGEEASNEVDGSRKSKETEAQKEFSSQEKHQPESSEPMGSGASYRPGTWQPPT
ncbi:uncharacterized protein LOC132308421 isoform X2 [Cornus florida]|uniref:uncharacterized protein LOC132308421 isoform X2 n=1 Tax=Cornus florida TaxID=4283 RepID=UPI002896BE6E|nr:uncharacterized protein LOC132308421 isoform X2 [Cornus florida]